MRENSDYIVDLLPKLVTGLTKDEISELDLSSQDAIATIGDTDGFTEEKVRKEENQLHAHLYIIAFTLYFNYCEFH